MICEVYLLGVYIITTLHRNDLFPRNHPSNTSIYVQVCVCVLIFFTLWNAFHFSLNNIILNILSQARVGLFYFNCCIISQDMSVS